MDSYTIEQLLVDYMYYNQACESITDSLEKIGGVPCAVLAGELCNYAEKRTETQTSLNNMGFSREEILLACTKLKYRKSIKKRLQ